MSSSVAFSKRDLSFGHSGNGRSDFQRLPFSCIEGGLGGDPSPLSQLILENLSVGIVVSNSDGKITLANAAAKRLAQADPEGKPLSVAPSIWGEMFDVQGGPIPPVEWPCMRALHGQTTVDKECTLMRFNGSSSAVLFSAFPIKIGASQGFGALTCFTDVSRHKQRELQLCEQAVFDERSRMAADIHDTILQGLTAILLQLEAAEDEFTEQPEQAVGRMRRVREIAREHLAEARRSVWALSQESFDDDDPAVALAFLARKLFEGTSIRVQTRLQKKAFRLTPEMRLGLLRMGKESLVNVQKHARATRVSLELMYRNRAVRLSVADDGRGFTPGPLLSTQSGYGLFSLCARAQRLGGSLKVQSRPRQGTRVVMRIPLRPQIARLAA
jgi:signal transduction histidine kinase